MSRLPVTPGELARHRRRLLWLTGGTLLVFPLLGAAGFVLPRVPGAGGIPPVAVTAVALAVGLFLSLRVEPMAQRRVVRIKETYAAGGDMGRLLRRHLRTYMVVLAWLLGIGLAGLAVALAGAGPRAAVWFQVIGALLTLLAWPTERKVRLLLHRAEELRQRERPADAAE